MENTVALVQCSKPRPKATSHLLANKREKVRKRGSEWITPSNVKGIKVGSSGAREASRALEEDDRGREVAQLELIQEGVVFMEQGWLLLPQIMEKNREMKRQLLEITKEQAAC